MTPTDFALILAGGYGVILPWVAVGVGSALSLMFLWMGIRTALSFFRGIGGDGYDSGAYSSYDAWDSYGDEGLRAYEFGIADGATPDEAMNLAAEHSKWVEDYDHYIESGFSDDSARGAADTHRTLREQGLEERVTLH